MRLVRSPLHEAYGFQLAHSQLGARGRITKATKLTRDHISSLLDAGITHVDIVIPDVIDVSEDAVAERLICSISRWDNCVGKRTNGGRFNLFASADGLVDFKRADIESFNTVAEEITLATCLPYTPVYKGDHIATLKIIPFCVPEPLVLAAEAILQQVNFNLRPWQTKMKVGLIQTGNQTVTEKARDKGLAIQQERLAFYGINQLHDYRVSHEFEDLKCCIQRISNTDLDILLILGASAICDRQDIIPRALTQAGGNVSYFGMPVDPGNLLLMGDLGKTKVIGLPGCVRSPALNGLDLILDRLIAGLPVIPTDIQAMGVGGLLRGQPQRSKFFNRADKMMAGVLNR